MARSLDYSKWDAIELSDDEDFECHPNVDKASMVRWRQSEVHRKRKEQKDKLAILALESRVNQDLVADLQALLSSSTVPEQQRAAVAQLQLRYRARMEETSKQVGTIVLKDRDARWQEPVMDAFVAKRIDTPQLLLDIAQGPVEGIPEAVHAAIRTLQAREANLQREVERERKDMEGKVNMDTLKEGFSKSSITKEKVVPMSSAAKPAASGTTPTIEVIHTPRDAAAAAAGSVSPAAEPTAGSGATAAPGQQQPQPPQDGDEDEEVYITYPPLQEFAKLSPQQLDASFALLQRYRDLLSTEEYTDQVLAEAFKLQTRGQATAANHHVHQALLLQYCRQLDLTSKGNGAALFFSKMSSPEHRARVLFTDDVKNTYARIAARVKVLAAEAAEREQAEREAARKRLAACLQPDGSLRLPLSDPPTEGELNSSAVFDSFPRVFQEALILQDVDKINEYLATLDQAEGEAVVQKCNDIGLLTLGSE